MIRVVKQNTLGKTVLQYEGEVITRDPSTLILQAHWNRPTYDLGYTCFEPGDLFTEYYYTDRWFNIFEITSASGTRKGWYCNVAAPARFFTDSIEQVDLFLDVWVHPDGTPLILDEDEFAADTTLTPEQRQAAHTGLQTLLTLLAKRQEVFSVLS